MHLLKIYQEQSKFLLRLAISLVFIWFGINQLGNIENFLSYLPNFILTSNFTNIIVIFNGVFELIFGILLLIGLFTRFTALILSINLLTIAIGLGYNDIFIRDLGLTLATFSIFLGGTDKWCLDKKINK